MLRLLRTIKWLISFLKRDWALSDYPVAYQRRDVSSIEAPPHLPDLIALPWVAYIPGWVGLIGDGETKREAYATLLENFTSYKESGESLPRPGTYKPIRFAPTEQIAPYEHMVKNFLAEVAAFEVEWLFVSDVSSLWNFISEDRRDEVFARIQDIYGVDASDIADGNLVRIFKLIEQRVLSV